MIDEGLEASAAENLILGLRLFDVGLFHAAFGIVTHPDDETLGPCLAAKARRLPLTGPIPLSARVYAGHLGVKVPIGEDELETLKAFASLLTSNPATDVDQHRRRGKSKPTSRLPGPQRR